MKHTSKRLQALVLVLAMCVSFLQIPSFAVAHSDNNAFVVKSVDVDKDGTLTIVKKCTDHGTCTETVTGKVVENATKTGYQAVDANGKKLNDVDKVEINTTKPTCIKPGTITYLVTVDNRTWTTEAYETDVATGKHTFAHPGVADDKLTNDQLEVPSDYKLLNDTATCLSKGEKTYAKICKVCGQVIETETVKRSSDISDHQFIKGEKGEPKVFDEVIEATTCGKKGEAYHYIQCNDCGQKLYDIGNKTFNATAKKDAKKFDIPTLPHTYEYTIKTNNPNGNFVTDATNATSLMSAFTVEGKCSVCNHTYKPTIVSVKEDTTKLVKADKCKAGSRTFTIVYKAIDYTKEKDKNGDWQTKKVTEEVTVPYYTNNTYAKDSAHDFGTPVTDNETIVKATCTKDGHYDMVKICKVCGKKEVVSTHTLFATGKHTAAAAKKENVVAATTKKGGSYDLVVRCADCGEIISSTHKTTAKIVVKASKINSVKNYKGKKAKITVKKAASVTGYQIQYGTKKNFKGAKSVKTKATTKTVSKLAKKKYYVRVRTYKVVSGKTYYSSWSGAKTVTIKK